MFEGEGERTPRLADIRQDGPAGVTNLTRGARSADGSIGEDGPPEHPRAPRSSHAHDARRRGRDPGAVGRPGLVRTAGHRRADEPNLRMFHVPPRVTCKEPVDDDGKRSDSPRTMDARSDVRRGATEHAVVRVPRHAVRGDPRLRRTGELCEYYINLEIAAQPLHPRLRHGGAPPRRHDPARPMRLVVEGRGRARGGGRARAVHRGGRRLVPLLGRASRRARAAARAAVRRGLVRVAPRPRLGRRRPARRTGTSLPSDTRPRHRPRRGVRSGRSRASERGRTDGAIRVAAHRLPRLPPAPEAAGRSRSAGSGTSCPPRSSSTRRTSRS